MRISVKVLTGVRPWGHARGEYGAMYLQPIEGRGVQVTIQWEDRDEFFWLAGGVKQVPEIVPGQEVKVTKGDPRRVMSLVVLGE